MRSFLLSLILLFLCIAPVVSAQDTGANATLLASFSVEPESDEKVIVTGKIDTQVRPQTDNLLITFRWSRTADQNGEPTTPQQVIVGQGGQPALASDGTYVLTISDLAPSLTYYFKQTITETGSTAPLSTKPGTFDTKDGFVAPGSNKEQELFDAKSYRLLAPWPGLSVLMDPDLCRQQKDAKVLPEDAICDINGFLNFAFKLLIGLTAVVLVLRLMFEGYQYVVTDIPFLKASAKGNFFTALLGLLLALSAYLILNTINPKLVNNTITIDSVAVGVEVQEELEDEGETTIDNRVIKITKSKIRYDKQYTNQVACAGTGGSQSTPNAATCVKYAASIVRSASGQYVEKGFALKLEKLDQSLKSKNIEWRVTEAWPGSRAHKAICHQIGLCVDMNHTSGNASNQTPTSAQVKTVIDSVAALGMCAHYEIKNNKTFMNKLISEGVPGKNLINFGINPKTGKTWISANHYSLYNGTCN